MDERLGICTYNALPGGPIYRSVTTRNACTRDYVGNGYEIIGWEEVANGSINRAELTVTTRWKDGQTFTHDSDIQYDVLMIDDYAKIRFSNGINFSCKCNKLIMGQNVFLDGRGEKGADAQQPAQRAPVFCSGTPAQHQFTIHPAFLEFAQNPTFGYFGYNASPGGNGGGGAKITILYHRYEGFGFDANIQALLEGGAPGSGAPGGDGAVVHCTVNPCGGVLQAGRGSGSGPGANGNKGTFKLQEF